MQKKNNVSKYIASNIAWINKWLVDMMRRLRKLLFQSLRSIHEEDFIGWQQGNGVGFLRPRKVFCVEMVGFRAAW